MYYIYIYISYAYIEFMLLWVARPPLVDREDERHHRAGPGQGVVGGEEDLCYAMLCYTILD